MPVFRVEKTSDYTVMANHHLRNKEISLKAKGLLSQMLSLPPDWDYTLTGLTKINREGLDAIRETVKELERAGYLTREQQRGPNGKFSSNDYVIREIPLGESPLLENPMTDNPTTEKPSPVHPITGPPTTEKPSPENPTQLNIQVLNTKESSTDSIKYPINQIPDRTKEADEMRKEREQYETLIKENIAYDSLVVDYRDHNEIDEIVEIILDAVCSGKAFLVIGKEDVPKEVVKSRFLKLDCEHIRYVLGCIHENTTKVRNIKQYILTCLYNAPATISNYYTALVNHDMYGGNA